MMMIIKRSTENVETELELFEKKYGITIPEQYQKFLLKYNGGETPETRFSLNRVSSDISSFFGVGEGEDCFENEPWLAELIEKDLLPVAHDVFGNYIAIDLSEKKNGTIYFCDHEKDNKTKLIADDFKTFVGAVKSKKMNKFYTMSIEEREQLLIANGNADKITDKLRENWRKTVERYGNAKQEKIEIDW